MSTALLNSQSCHSLADWLCYIEQNHPVHQIELGLERVLQVAQRADLQLLPGKIILIGGTNGKGTTACCLEQLLLAQGFSVGVYSSPHLLTFNERLRLNGKDVADADWASAFAFIEQLRGDTALTYFEFTTLVAFRLLQQQQVDFCLIEVGLGGRLDATNIVTPDVSVITTVDLDHQDWLGNDRETIGREKAGIFRLGGATVIGELNPPQSVLQHGAALQCNTMLVQRDFHYSERADSWQWQSSSAVYNGLPLPAMPVQNAACALAVLQQLAVLPTPEQLHAVLTHLTLPGRMQWLQQRPGVIVDVAHNPQSAAYLAAQLQRLKPRFARIVALTGMLKDKDIHQTLLPLTQLFDQWHLVSLGGARGASAQQLADNLSAATAQVHLHADVQQAYLQISAELQPDELLVVFGSFFTVSAVLAGSQEAT
ncbi:bifunctional tetrahydrofolate synthase/dihydrofolate synthase [Rheinheimera maricola]|uniref:Dihydrofolate synthase/folylpolyglutamate synthase n=1 Tax=Rheinheimera maricola TaxID=2793282 RepID=A0ABS7XBF7_9GAMM|nr:bifunctional tetrahydrofolate synthase/dihydrofolate synthase [Rheinheimera maricola]MBZ9612058.1 bifunctional tetrahydrofolate synthase/dihydrofolate synthase [Rheinheimera maricola]